MKKSIFLGLSPSGQPMVDSFTIKNFRSFADVEADDCRRINVIVGDNGSGKTALLEALFLAGGASPELALRTRQWRGFDGTQFSGSSDDIYKELWGDLFHNFDSSRQAIISLKGTGKQQRSVTVTLFRQDHKVVTPPSRRNPGAPPKVSISPHPLEFKWKIYGEADTKIYPIVQDNKLLFPPTTGTPLKLSFYASSRASSIGEMVTNFSTQSKLFKQAPFVEAFKNHYPHISDISILISAGSPTLFATVHGIDQKIPLASASGGMMKLAAILLSMEQQAGGIILIDEIENGFYHERFPLVWETIRDFSRLYDCQVFASTHSVECLNALALVAEKDPEDFSLLRTVQSDGSSKIRHFPGKQFADAVLSNIEIR